MSTSARVTYLNHDSTGGAFAPLFCVSPIIAGCLMKETEQEHATQK
jgi:hypothetical protein